MIHEFCAVEVGTHHAPFFVGRTASGHETMLCARHRRQLEERFEYDDERGLEPYEWRLSGADR